MTQNWFYQVMGEVYGPVDDNGFRSLVESNDIGRDTFVRKQDGDWLTADRVPGLFPAASRPRKTVETKLYFQVMGEIRGPYGHKALRRLAAHNEITRDTFVRRDGEDWVTADKIPGLLK